MDKLIIEDKLKLFQELINYQFQNREILLEALTTPLYGNENNLSHYEILETLGDAVIKLIFSLKIYNSGENDPGRLTKTKQCLEDNQTFLKVATEIKLWKYIISSKKQKVRDTSILADVIESICGAIYIDSGNNLEIVEQKIINTYFYDWDALIEGSSNLFKNQLLEYLQNIFKITPTIKFEYEKLGPDNDARWIVKNPEILDKKQNRLLNLPDNLRSEKFRRIKDAEKESFDRRCISGCLAGRAKTHKGLSWDYRDLQPITNKPRDFSKNYNYTLVSCFDSSGKFVAQFDSISSVVDSDYSYQCVSHCLCGRNKTHKGLTWRYSDA